MNQRSHFKLFTYLVLAFLYSFFEIQSEEKRQIPKNLPFEVSEKQRISEEDLKNKTEGWYPVFIPILFKDQTLGAGYGVTGTLINNGKKADSLFEYSPYRDALSVTLANSTKGMQLYFAEYSIKYLFDTPYSFHLSGGYEKIANALYFGVGEETMKPLSGRLRNQPENPQTEKLTFSEYEENLAYRSPARNSSVFGNHETDKMNNRYLIETPFLEALGDRVFFGLWKLATGFSITRSVIKTYDRSVYKSPDPYFHDTPFKIQGTPIDANSEISTPHGKTKLTRDQESKRILGYNGGFVNSLRFGFAYDSRDFSLDPNRGMLCEITHETSRKLIGSDFHFDKTFTQIKFFYSPFPEKFKKFVVAGRIAGAYVSRGAPFFTYSNFNGIDSYIVTLGGSSTLRGYQLSRFVGPVTGFANLEFRWKFFEISDSESHFTFHLIPFYDTGRVWDNLKNVNAINYAKSYGIGFQVSYNLNTILRFDFAKSSEDRTFNFQMAQPF